MLDLNKTMLVGRLTRDAEIKYAQSGAAVAQLRVAWSRKYGDKERKLFMDAVAFGKNAEWVEKWCGAKGNAIYLEGSLETQEWTNDAGEKRSAIKLVVDRASFAESKKEAESGGNGGGNHRPQDDEPPARREAAPASRGTDTRDDLPF